MSKIRLTAILKLALFGIGIIIGVFLLVTRTHAGRIPEPKARAATALTFNWSMPKRFGAKRADGIMDFHWSEATRSYNEDYVNPHGWKVDFNACSPDMPPGSTFTWHVDGVALPNPNPTSCTFVHEFEKQGTYTVQLTRTAPDNTLAMAQASITIKDLLIVSLGDSFASGQGNPDLERHDPTPAKWVDRICARSEHSGPAQSALSIEEKDPHTSVTFLSFACSGADINAGILGEQIKGNVRVKSQIRALQDALNGRPIDALLISIGGNDIGFSTLVALCIVDFNCAHYSGTLNKRLSRLDERYQDLNTEIVNRLSVKRVFITEYPDLVRDEKGEFCDRQPDFDHFLKRIDEKEAKWASTSVIKGLNGKVEEAANKYNWIYVTNVAEQFKKHGYCANKAPWVRTFGEAKRVQGFDKPCDSLSLETLRECMISSGAVHPTRDGHTAYAASLVEALKTKGVITPPDLTPASEH